MPRAARFLALLLYAATAHATYWTVTHWWVITSGPDVYGRTVTSIARLKSGVKPTVSPVSTEAFTITLGGDVTYIDAFLPPGAVPADAIADTTTTEATAGTVYVEPVVYTAPASCPTPFVATLYTQAFIPAGGEDQVTPTAVSTYTGTYAKGAGYAYYTSITAYLSPSAVPFSITTNDPYVQNCLRPGQIISKASNDTDDSGQGGSGNGTYYDGCSILTACYTYRTWVIVVATLLPSLFVLGFVESFLWFRALMLGKGCLRTGTICWILITFWMLCFTRVQHSRSPEDQIWLRQQWDQMSAGTRWRLWCRWGLRLAYPVEVLGDPRTTGHRPPLMQQQGQFHSPMHGPYTTYAQHATQYQEQPIHQQHELPQEHGEAHAERPAQSPPHELPQQHTKPGQGPPPGPPPQEMG